MDAVSQVPMEAVLPKHILAIWVIVLIILAIMVIMTSLLLCLVTAIIICHMQTYSVLNGTENLPRGAVRDVGGVPSPSLFLLRKATDRLCCVNSGA
ncbi:small integral membrane protein 3-like [Panthera pardus]|uniref:Small integral membrane protein 3-like n=1 Tax=Panthera pardus TaxID=9691 RepID=A0A9W2VY15_PANPR|nr:small integral membrane protein 3-like [Panthera tigris]XP_053763609.1 small integral membrane protein 3-like [Panthera pardus]XP_060493660.1 small integral membrane protein 3-like [Panthera onca]